MIEAINNSTQETVSEYVPMNHGHLHVFKQYVNGVLALELFTFQSLASVMGKTQAALEGRYIRGNLSALVIPIRVGQGRPMRGFAMSALQSVIDVITQSGARIADTTPPPEPVAAIRDALPVIDHEGLPYILFDAVVEFYAVSAVTARRRLRTAKLYDEVVHIRPPAGSAGGRPRVAFPADRAARIAVAMTGQAERPSALRQVLERSVHVEIRNGVRLPARPGATRPLVAELHTHPVLPGAVVEPVIPAVDGQVHMRLAPNGKVELVPGPSTLPPLEGIDAMQAEIERMLAGAVLTAPHPPRDREAEAPRLKITPPDQIRHTVPDMDTVALDERVFLSENEKITSVSPRPDIAWAERASKEYATWLKKKHPFRRQPTDAEYAAVLGLVLGRMTAEWDEIQRDRESARAVGAYWTDPKLG